jgi:hypothetical protein
MTHDEYLLELKAIEQEKYEALQDLMKRFIIANNTQKKGDIVSDNTNTIVIEKIMYGLGHKPCAIYFGTCLKKDGTTRKDGKKVKVYQSNLVKK